MKKNILFFTGLLIILGFLLIFVYNDDFLYKNEIIKIKDISTIDTSTSTNDLGLEEEYYKKKITGIVTNGKDRGKKKVFTYEESYSSVVTDRYKVGDKVITVKGEIEELKRDFYVTILLAVFVVLIVLIGEVNGLLSIGSVILNTIIFCLGIDLYFRGIDILSLCIIESIIFSILSLFIAGGINKKTKAAIVSVIVSVSVLLVMVVVIAKITNYDGVNFNELSFLTVPPEEIIIPELLIGSLGAIMDVAITMAAAISELVEKDKNISIKNLKKSSKQIGKDIMSTMTNVLFFTYLCGGLPIFVLAIRNGFSVYNYISTNFSLELTRFLVGSIGIVMTIPIATFTCIRMIRNSEKMFKKKKKAS